MAVVRKLDGTSMVFTEQNIYEICIYLSCKWKALFNSAEILADIEHAIQRTLELE